METIIEKFKDRMCGVIDIGNRNKNPILNTLTSIDLTVIKFNYPLLKQLQMSEEFQKVARKDIGSQS